MTIHYHANIDYFSPPAGTFESLSCRACHTIMLVDRNVRRTMGKMGQPLPEELVQDIFTCPNAGQDWHSQIIALGRERQATASKKLDDLLAEEIRDILITREATKPNMGSSWCF